MASPYLAVHLQSVTSLVSRLLFRTILIFTKAFRMFCERRHLIVIGNKMRSKVTLTLVGTDLTFSGGWCGSALFCRLNFIGFYSLFYATAFDWILCHFSRLD